jgi:uncharacterized membrane protein YqaE (UPF0057 family)
MTVLSSGSGVGSGSVASSACEAARCRHRLLNGVGSARCLSVFLSIHSSTVYSLTHHLFIKSEMTVRLVLAIVLPWVSFFTIGRPLAELVCLLLQITLIGWLPASLWAVYALSQFKTDQKIAKLMRQMKPMEQAKQTKQTKANTMKMGGEV